MLGLLGDDEGVPGRSAAAEPGVDWEDSSEEECVFILTFFDMVTCRDVSPRIYRVILVVEYLGWVDFYLGSWPLPKQNAGSSQILVNPTQVFVI